MCACRLVTYLTSFFNLNINQLDAVNFMSLFHASTCFEHYVLIVRRPKCCYTVSGIITPVGVMIPDVYIFCHFFYILLTVHLNIFIIILTNLMH